MKRCCRCREIKPHDAFYKKGPGRSASMCIECRRGYNAAYYRERASSQRPALMEFLTELEETRRLMTMKEFEDGLVAGIGIAIFRLRSKLGILKVGVGGIKDDDRS